HWPRSRTIRRVMFGSVRPLFQTGFRLARDLVALIRSAMRSRAQLAAENLFLRKQLAWYPERQVKARRADDATRVILVALSSFVEWRHLLTIVKLETLIRWHRKGFRLWWRWKSRALVDRTHWSTTNSMRRVAVGPADRLVSR